MEVFHMKYETTQKAIRQSYKNVIAIGYCKAQFLLQYMSPEACTTRREGWASDIYIINHDTAISTGYKPFGNIKPSIDLLDYYNDKARKIDSSLPFEDRVKVTTQLLDEFIEKITK